jgi:hypothetical protein
MYVVLGGKGKQNVENFFKRLWVEHVTVEITTQNTEGEIGFDCGATKKTKNCHRDHDLHQCGCQL